MKLHTRSVLMITADMAEGERRRADSPDAIASLIAQADQVAGQVFPSESWQFTSHFADASVFAAFSANPSEAIAMAASLASQLGALKSADAKVSESSSCFRIAVHAIDAVSTSQGSLADARYANYLLRSASAGQVLISAAAAQIVQNALPESCALRDLGTHHMADLGEPEHVYQLLTPQMKQTFPPIDSLNGAKNNLPLATSRFIGREDDISVLKQLLGSSRMITLIGTSGIGKTRLAIQAAAAMMDELADGAWFVELSSLPDPSLVVPSIAAALKVREDPAASLSDAIVNALEHKQLLLVFDGCDAARAGCAAAIDTILDRCEGVRVLASASGGLGTKIEEIFPVRALKLPRVGSGTTPLTIRATEAGELFNDSASNANQEFTLTHSNAPAAARLISAAAGIPAALQLLAHNVSSFDIEPIAVTIEGRVKLDNTDLLASQRAVVHEVAGWSIEQLHPTARTALYRLSVIAGPWTQAAMQAVAIGGESTKLSAVSSTLQSLASSGLISSKQQSGVVRYTIPDPVKEYAIEKLSKADRTSARRRYAEYYLRMAQEAGSDLEGTDAARMALWLEKEYPNLCAALAWCREDPQQSAAGLQLAQSLRRFWEVRGYPGEGQALLLSAAVWGDRSDRTTLRADALKRTGDSALQSGNLPLARARHQEALAINRELGDRAREAINLNNLGNVARAEGDHAAAQSMHEQALAINREIGDQRREAVNLHNLGNAYRDQGAIDSAREKYVEAIAVCSKLADRLGIGHNLNSLARLAYTQGDRREALRLYEEALTNFRAAGSDVWVAHNQGEIDQLKLRPSTDRPLETASAQK